MSDGNSLFSKFKKEPAPQQPPRPAVPPPAAPPPAAAPPPMPAAAPAPVSLSAESEKALKRVPELEKEVAALKAELAGLKAAAAGSGGPSAEQVKNLEAAGAGLSARLDELAARLGGAASRDELKKMDFMLAYQASLLEGFKKALAGAPAPGAQDEALRALDARLSGLERALAGPPKPPPPPGAPAAPPQPGEELAAVRAEMEALRDLVRSGLASVPGPDEFKKRDAQAAALAAAFEGLKETFASAYDLGARLKAAEESLAEIRTSQSEERSAARARLAQLAERSELAGLQAQLAALKEAVASARAVSSSLSSEFSSIADECRRALGEARGHAKALERQIVAGGMEDHLRATIEKIAARLAEAETAMHAGFADLGGRLTAGETLYKKMFSDAEARLRKAVEPELKAMDSSLRTLRDKVLWLTDEYDIVMRRKVRALEGKYAVLELIEKRLEERKGH